MSYVQIRPPTLFADSKILKSLNPFLVRNSAAEIPAIPAPIMITFDLLSMLGFSCTSVAIFSSLINESVILSNKYPLY